MSGLSLGSHAVTFKSIPGWTTPASQSVAVSHDSTVKATGSYVRQTGTLKVIISPREAVDAWARWNVDGGTWKRGGATVSRINTGQHTVAFKDITDWITPQNQTVLIENGKTASILATYVKQQTAPSANFSYTPTTGPKPLAVMFTNRSTGTISSY